jgi:putative tryptophan/tyrosine transport system substrate-binding protein
MKRRDFIAGLGSAAAWPVVTRARSERVRRIGLFVLGDENGPVGKTFVSVFTQGLADLGWTNGHNVRIDLRWHADDIHQIPAIAQELVGLQPDIIVPNSTAATIALQRETRTIPIVFASVSEPVASGLVAALKQPGGNITGFALFETTLGASGLNWS